MEHPVAIHTGKRADTSSDSSNTWQLSIIGSTFNAFADNCSWEGELMHITSSAKSVGRHALTWICV